MDDHKGQIADNSAESENPFATMGMIKFWILSTIFYITFPASLAVCYLVLGPQKTKQLIRTLVNDFLQTIIIFLVVLVLIIWGIWHVLAPLFGG
ncbi:MAG: PTS beta-glucoside transporter subunit IIABC [Proteobacteria bacterium]|nr:PTS beta-glucoside transporter subunit IIABC [Pseudomonadota bacterium]MDA0846392.1 PTS beta-glucoside transporter subunit IIABC [Pseudomonadota bacterium]